MLKAHWAQVGLARLPNLEPNQDDLFSYNLFTISHADWQRVRDLHIAYYQELRSIVVASEPADRVALVNVQLMRLDEPLATAPNPAAPNPAAPNPAAPSPATQR
jgi:hypothetical protein